MKVFNNILEYKKVPKAIVTIGTFDGVHRGHQAILKSMVKMAKETGGESVVVTFYPHPRQVLNIDSSHLRFINTQEDKIKLIEKTGIDNLIIINFTKEFSRTLSEDFILNYIVKRIEPVKIIIGYDHHFGKNRMGDFSMLFELGLQYHFKVERIPAQDVDNIAISSTKIRHSLQQGDIRLANKLLGYEYSYSGTVIHGAEVGHILGYKTANLELKQEYFMIEEPGVFAAYADFDDMTYPAMVYTGQRPTLDDNRPKSLEAHIINYEGDLYGKNIRLRFIDKIRDEHKFNNLQELEQQIETDEKKIREVLEAYEKNNNQFNK
ncbi:MAG TPA: bifunctional riboflavin kinase/FAD synthetase [Bacteroidetes bacterium]|nr:bifunctional riboflavin kinase/FAD synthetase [Candidatus Limimorpha avicola]